MRVHSQNQEDPRLKDDRCNRRCSETSAAHITAATAHCPLPTHTPLAISPLSAHLTSVLALSRRPSPSIGLSGTYVALGSEHGPCALGHDSPSLQVSADQTLTHRPSKETFSNIQPRTGRIPCHTQTGRSAELPSALPIILLGILITNHLLNLLVNLHRTRFGSCVDSTTSIDLDIFETSVHLLNLWRMSVCVPPSLQTPNDFCSSATSSTFVGSVRRPTISSALSVQIRFRCNQSTIRRARANSNRSIFDRHVQYQSKCFSTRPRIISIVSVLRYPSLAHPSQSTVCLFNSIAAA
jgi:hypothetical protein